jgi:signal transduction histidine kinase
MGETFFINGGFTTYMPPNLLDLLTYENIMVVILGVLTSVVSMALFIVAFLPYPRVRLNQLFGLLMLLLALYSLSNIALRFYSLTAMRLEFIFRTSTTLYYLIVALVYILCHVFVGQESKGVIRFTVVYVTLVLSGLWAGLYGRLFPTADSSAPLFTLSPLGIAHLVVSYLLLGAALYKLGRNPTPSSRQVLPALASIVLGAFLLISLRPLALVFPDLAFVFIFPYGQVSLLLGAVIFGYAILQKQLFNPMRQLHTRLAATHARLQKAQRYKHQFLASTSHELRTPLNAILGYSELMLMEEENLTPAQKDRLQRVHINAHRLLNVINAVLDLNKLEAGTFSLYLEKVDGAEVVQRLVGRYAEAARLKGLAFSAKAEGDLPLRADELRLYQALSYLLDNALKFTQQGSITFSARVEEGYVLFMVADTGIGIAPEALPFIFEPFRQVDMRSNRAYDGLGAGLALAWQVATLHGGTLVVVSEVGIGSCFSFSLPESGPVPLSPPLPDHA